MELSNTKIILKSEVIVWCLYGSEEFKKHISGEISQILNCNLMLFNTLTVSLDELKKHELPDVLIVEAVGPWANRITNIFAHYEELQNIEPALLVFGDDSNNHDLKIALRLGASDFIPKDADIGIIATYFTEISNQKEENSELGELIVFCNSKGGAGATTVALNTSIEMAKTTQKPILIVDIDFRFGALAEYMGVSPKYWLSELIDKIDELDQVSVQGFVTTYSDKVKILSLGTDLHSPPTGKQLAHLLFVLRKFYSYIVVDCSRGFDESIEALINQTSKLFVLTQQNLVSISNTKKHITQLVRDFGIKSQDIRVILNRFDKKQTLGLRDVESLVGDVAVITVPNDYKVVLDSNNLGKPVQSAQKKGPIVSSFRSISSTIVPVANENSGWLSKLF
ncbi:CpaE family protein [Vibrio breoganii]